MGPTHVMFRNVSVLVPPSARVERAWAARNGMTPAQFRTCVHMHYFFLVTRYVRKHRDAVVVAADEECTMHPLLCRLERLGYNCVRARKAVCAPVCTWLYACCGGVTAPGSCRVFATVSAQDVLALPTVTRVTPPTPRHAWCV